jgi:hypothetical protein
MFRSKYRSVVIATALVLTSHVMAQSASSAAASAPPTASGTSASPSADANKPMLRVQLVVSRYEGEKKSGSLPYVFVVTPNPASQMHIRFGVEVPVPSPNFAASTTSPGPVEYRNMGTNIDCFNVRDLTGGRYQFDVNVQNSAALPGQDPSKDARPLFRRFDSSFTVVLRDGQSMQTIASTNPVTGEVLKIDVTLDVLR